jgi:hypothetical protein
MNMNKKWITALIGILSSGFLCAESNFQLPSLSLDTNCGFDTEYVYRGTRLNQQVFTPKVEISTSFFGNGDIYFGTKASLATKNSRFKEYDFYIGFSCDATDIFALDARFIHHIRRNRYRWLQEVPKEPIAKRRSEEISVGILTDLLLKPSLYYFCDFTWKRHNFEGRVNHSHDLSQWGVNDFAVDFSAKMGYDHTKRPFSLKEAFGNGSRFNCLKKSYFYYGAGADLVYTINPNAIARAGARYEGANGKKAWIAKISEKYRRNLFWFSTSIDCNF